MKVLVATNAHIYKLPDGSYWCKNIYGYSFWTRYLDVFDAVKIVARVKELSNLEGKMIRVDGENVEVFEVPFFQGPIDLLKKYIIIKKVVKNVEEDCDVAIFRMPSPTAKIIYDSIRKKIPIGGEIVFDPFDAAINSKQSLLRTYIYKITSKYLKAFCLKANGVAYVTERAIQKNFPSYAHIHGESNKFFHSFYSSVSLSEDSYTGPRIYNNKKIFKLVLSDASMNSYRKGEKVVIETIKYLREWGFNAIATFIGDGNKRNEFEKYAEELGVKSYINFIGMLPTSKEVRDVLIDSDIFIFPTQAEGLPRGIIEAMAVGLPVISSPVGGIPELIDEKYLINPYDSVKYASEISRLIKNQDELSNMSKVNYLKSLNFNEKILQNKRNDFYLKLKNLVK